MNKRERTLIVVMAAAVVLGGTTLLLDSKKAKAKKTAKGIVELDTKGFAEQQRALLGSVRLGAGERLALDKVAGVWAESPFIDRIATINTDVGVVSEFRYTGYMALGDVRMALINGREYKTGETIRATDFIVDTIEPDQVILVAAKGGRRLTVALQTSNARRNKP